MVFVPRFPRDVKGGASYPRTPPQKNFVCFDSLAVELYILYFYLWVASFFGGPLSFFGLPGDIPILSSPANDKVWAKSMVLVGRGMI